MPLPANIYIHKADDDDSGDVGYVPANILIHRADDDDSSSDSMSGLDNLGCEDEVGFDAMSLLSGAGGILSGFGGMFGGGGGGSGKPDAQAQILQMQKQQAEQAAQNLKLMLAVGAAIVGAGIIVMVTKK